MREFFDTSVLVAAFWRGHPRHRASIALLAKAAPSHSACGIHTVAEVYATMTALPVKPAIPPEQAMLFVGEVRSRLDVITLTTEEYFDTLREASERGFTSGRIYDALLLRCAAKCKARTIHTLNAKHFRAIAPELASKLSEP